MLPVSPAFVDPGEMPLSLLSPALHRNKVVGLDSGQIMYNFVYLDA